MRPSKIALVAAALCCGTGGVGTTRGVTALVAPAPSRRSGALRTLPRPSSSSITPRDAIATSSSPTGMRGARGVVRLRSQKNDDVPYGSPGYGRFKKNESGNLFGNNPLGKRYDDNADDEEEEDEASYRLARDWAARRGMNVYDSTPTMGSRGRNASMGVRDAGRGNAGAGARSTGGSRNSFAANAAGRGAGNPMRPRPPPPRQSVGYGRYGDANAGGGTSSSSPSFGSSSSFGGSGFYVGGDDDRGANDRSFGSNDGRKASSSPSTSWSSPGEGRVDDVYEVIITREEGSSRKVKSSRGVENPWKTTKDAAFPPPLPGIRDSIAQASKNLFSRSTLGKDGGDDDRNMTGRDAGGRDLYQRPTSPRPPQVPEFDPQLQRGEEVSSKNPFRTRYGINSGVGQINESSGGNGSYVLQRNHDSQRTQSDRQPKYDTSTSSPSSYPFNKHALSELASNERENRRYPPPPAGGTSGTRPPPPPPQYTNMKQFAVPPLGPTMGGPTMGGPTMGGPTMGERMPPRQPPTSPQRQQPRRPPPLRPPPQQQPPPRQPMPATPIRPPADFTYGRNAYQSIPLKPLSPPLSQIASSMPPPYEAPQGTIEQRTRQQREMRQQPQPQWQPQQTAGQRTAGQQQLRPPQGGDSYRPPPTMNRYPPPYQPRRANTPPPMTYDPLRSRPPSPYGASRTTAEARQQQPMQGRRQQQPPATPGQRRQVPLSQRALQPNAEPLDRASTSIPSSQASQTMGPLPFTQLDSSEFRQPYGAQSYKQNSQGNAGTVVGSFSQRSDLFDPNRSFSQRSDANPINSYPQHLKQQQSQSSMTSSTASSSTSSFKPPPFQSIPQSDFRQPYPGEELPPLRDEGHRDPSASFGSDPFRGDPSFGGGPPSGYDQPPLFGDDDVMLRTPFAVPPAMMMPPPPPDNAGGAAPPRERWPRSSAVGEEEGVKVPKDPFAERQRRQRQTSETSSSSDVKIPKDPFVERQKRQQQQQQPQQWQQQQQQQPQQWQQQQEQQRNERKQSLERQEERQVKVPKDPFSTRQEQPRQWENRPNEPPPWQSTMQFNDGARLPKDPFGDRQQRRRSQLTNTYQPPKNRIMSPPSRFSPGSNGGGNDRRNGIGKTSNVGEDDDVTYEDYSSYFDAP